MDAKEMDRIVERGWAAGDPVRTIAAQVGRNPGWVSRRAQFLGLPPRSPRITEAERLQAIASYSDGASLTAVARQLGRSVEAVRAALVRSGVAIIGAGDRSRRWPVRHDAFTPPLSAEAWYWIGFLAADGSVGGTRLSLGLTPTSQAALRRFARFMGCPDKPPHVTAGGRQLVIEVHSRGVVDDLASHGVTRGKTWNLATSPEAAREPAFWLGYLDGDGCVVISPNGVPKIHFVGTRTLMSQCADFVGDHVLQRRPSVHRASNQSILWEVAVSGDSARRLAETLLFAHGVSLEAKRAKLEQAGRFTSRVTLARLAVRKRPCSWCGAWVERFPSQMTGERVFCSQSHSGKWNAALRKQANPAGSAAVTSSYTDSRWGL